MVEQKFLFPNQEASFKMFQRPFGSAHPYGALLSPQPARWLYWDQASVLFSLI